MFFRILVEDPIHTGSFEDHIRLDFDGAKRRGGVGREIGIAGSGAEDDHAAFFQVAYGAAADEGLGDLLHADGGEQAGLHAFALEGVLQGHGIDDRGEHAHVVGLNAVHALGGAFHAAEDVSTADHDGDFDAVGIGGFDLFGVLFEHVAVDAVALFTEKGFAAEFEEDAFVCCHSGCGERIKKRPPFWGSLKLSNRFIQRQVEPG